MKKILMAVALVLLFAGGAWANDGKFIINGTNAGQYTDLAITGADTSATTKSGLKATIDLATVSQTSASATTTPVLKLTQAADTAPVFSVVCPQGQAVGVGSTCTCYSTTIGTKAGTIRILVNGTPRYMQFFNTPN